MSENTIDKIDLELQAKFYRTVQEQIQNALLQALNDESIEAFNDTSTSRTIDDLMFCFGSSVASIVFNLVSDENYQLSPDGFKFIEEVMESFDIGYNEKIDLLKSGAFETRGTIH